MLSAEPRVTVLEEKARGDRCCNFGHKGEKMYSIAAPGPKVLMEAKEDLDCCCRNFGCFCRRDFDIRMGPPGFTDPAYVIDHKYMCCSWLNWCACCSHRMTVTRKRDNNVIGGLRNDCKFCCSCYPQFTVKDAAGTPVYRVSKDVNCCAAMCGRRKCCGIHCQVPTGFTIKTLTGPRKGSHGSFSRLDDERSAHSSQDAYSLEFPPDANEDQRVLLVAAAMLVDYAVYDRAVPAKKPATAATMA